MKKAAGPLSPKMKKVLKALDQDDWQTPDLSAKRLWEWVRADEKNRGKFMERVMASMDAESKAEKKVFEKSELLKLLNEMIKRYDGRKRK